MRGGARRRASSSANTKTAAAQSMEDAPCSPTNLTHRALPKSFFGTANKKGVRKKAMDDSPCSPTVSPSVDVIHRPLPSSRASAKNVIRISGVPVEFPFPPYGTQLAFMNRVISTLDRSVREGHCHALLESPTGTGKTLSLLCSVLAWQENQKLKYLQENLTHSSSRANPEAMTDPLNCGGGFIPETQPSGTPAVPPATSKREKKIVAPTIFYSSRTHAQISQVIREYEKTTYRVPMAVLGSRRHYCTNPQIQGADNVDEQCKLLLKDTRNGCPEYKNFNKVKTHPSLGKGGCHEVHDIEDLVNVGQTVKGCSYFASRSMAKEAELVFCPYNYVINPIIRDAMEVNISQSVVIFDEAHNIENIARDAGSIDLGEEPLLQLQAELLHLVLNDGVTYQPLYEMTQDILSWIGRKVPTLAKREYQHYASCWTGDHALKELQEANLTLQNFSIMYECAKKAIKAASDVDSINAHLSGMASSTLEGLFSSLNYFFSGNGINTSNYELALQRFVKDRGGWTNMLSLWCLNPAVVFNSITEVTQSVILTSGTLSPLSTFSSELGIQFGSSLEAPHVIDVNSQVWAAAIANGPGNYPLNASYRTSDEYSFQDSIGKSLEKIFEVVPGGCLVFFPSYKLLHKVSSRWKETGQWAQLNAIKTVFVEPRHGSQDTFDGVLRRYYESVQSTQQAGKKSRGKRLGLKSGSMVKSATVANKEGAAFLAVCRGKASEGMDFSDDNARAVVIVGIPFPNIFEIKLAQKKKFNDAYESSKKLLNGNEWYCQEAFRALNQAIGRCIRHRFDYGAVILLDERFHRERNRAYISKWLRKSIRLYSCFEDSLDSLKSFFRDAKDAIGTSVSSNASPQEDVVTATPVDRRKNKNRSNIVAESGVQQNVVPESTILLQDEAIGLAYPSSPFAAHTQDKLEAIVVNDEKDGSVATECIVLESESEEDMRWSEMPDDPDLTVVKETPSMSKHSPGATREFSGDDYLSPLTSHQFAVPHHSKYNPKSFFNSYGSPDSAICTVADSPQNEVRHEYDFTEQESPWSVNSKVGKRRKLPCISSVSAGSEFRTPTQVLERFSSLASSLTVADASLTAECSEFPVTATEPVEYSKQIDSDESSLSHGADRERYQVFCSHCHSPLGRSEERFFVLASLGSTSKVHLLSLKGKKKSESGAFGTPSVVDILLTEKSSVDQRLFGVAQGRDSGQGVWCREDGCVYSSVFCPFCDNKHKCLGVQIVATDESNTNLQNKIMLFLDDLVIKNAAAADTKKWDPLEDKASPWHGESGAERNSSPIDFAHFAYVPPVDNCQEKSSRYFHS